MKKIILIPILLILILVLLNSCRNSRSNTVKALTNQNWILKEFNGEQVSVTGAKAPFIIFQQKDNRVNGNAGCNNFFGSYQINGELITISHVGATKMACEDMQLETHFFQFLQKPLTYSIRGNELLLKNNDGNVGARFEKVKLKI